MKPSPGSAEQGKTPSAVSFRKWARRFLFTFLILLGLGIIALMSVDLNTLRGPLSETLSRAAGLKVEIGGLGIDWAGGLALRAEGVTVLAPREDHTLFSAEALFLKLRWRPLLEGRYEVEEADILRPVVEVSAAEAAPGPEPSPAGPSGKKPAPLTARQMGWGSLRNLLIGLHLNAEKVRVRQGLVLWIPPGKSPLDPLSVDLGFDVRIDRSAPNRLDVRVEHLEIATGKLRGTGHLTASNLLQAEGRIECRLALAAAEMDDLETLLPYLPEAWQKPWRRVQPAGRIEQLALEGNMPSDWLWNPQPRPWKTLQLKTVFKLKNVVLQPPADRPELRLGMPRLSGTLEWARNLLSHELEGDLGGAPFRVEGTLGLALPLEEPLPLNTTLSFSEITASRLNAGLPASWRLTRGQASARIKLTGDLKHPELWEARGTFQGTDWLAVFLKDEALQIPLSQWTGALEWKRGILRLAPFRMVPPHGRLKGEARWEPERRRWDLTFKGAGLRVEDFYRRNIDGDLVVQGRWTGRVSRGRPLLAGLSGPLHLKARNGRLYQLELLRILLTVLNPVSVPRLAQKGLPYQSLGGDFQWEGGRVSTANLALLTPDMNIYLKGAAWPLEDRLEMDGRFQPSKSLDQVVGSLPLLGDILKGGRQGGVIETRFKLRGSLKNPRVILDVPGSLLGKGKDMLRELGRVPEKVTP